MLHTSSQCNTLVAIVFTMICSCCRVVAERGEEVRNGIYGRGKEDGLFKVKSPAMAEVQLQCHRNIPLYIHCIWWELILDNTTLYDAKSNLLTLSEQVPDVEGFIPVPGLYQCSCIYSRTISSSCRVVMAASTCYAPWNLLTLATITRGSSCFLELEDWSCPLKLVPSMAWVILHLSLT